jgi:Pentapeptide repeats (8 copies)
MTTQDTSSLPSDHQEEPGQPQRSMDRDEQLKSTSNEYSSKKTRIEKFSLISQGIGALATPLTIVFAIISLIVSVNQFKMQQAASTMQSLDQQHQATLVGYLDDMSNFLLVNKLSASKRGDEVQELAQARTYEAVRNLDGTRKGTLVRFLWEAGLINGMTPIISLSGADLSGAILDGDLSGANFCVSRGTVIKNCVATKNDINLSGANLIGADLSGASLSDADLQGATYNTYPMNVTDAQGNSETLGPTQWPQGFDPKGAICVDC